MPRLYHACIRARGTSHAIAETLESCTPASALGRHSVPATDDNSVYKETKSCIVPSVRRHPLIASSVAIEHIRHPAGASRRRLDCGGPIAFGRGLNRKFYCIADTR